MAFPYQHCRENIVEEVKFAYTNTSFNSLTYHGVIVPINNIRTGFDSINNRIGRSISQRCLRIRGWIFLQKTQDIAFVGGVFSPSQATRLLVVEDLQPTGNLPPTFTLADLFEETPALLSIVSDFKFANMNRFRIWYDKTFVFDAFSHDTGNINGFVNRSSYWVDEYIELNGLRCTYGPMVGRGGGSPTIFTSPLHFVAFSTVDPAPVGGTQVGTNGSVRCTIGFTDD